MTWRLTPPAFDHLIIALLSPQFFFTPALAHLWIHLYFRCCKMQCYLSLLAPVFCRGSLVTFVLLPSGAAATCTLFTCLILNLHCLVLCCCRVSSLAHNGHVKVNGRVQSATGHNEYKCSWQAVVIVFLPTNCRLAATIHDSLKTKIIRICANNLGYMCNFVWEIKAPLFYLWWYLKLLINVAYTNHILN